MATRRQRNVGGESAGVSIRRTYVLTITNEHHGPCDPAWGRASTFRGTPRQVVAEVRRWRRFSGDLGIRVHDARGNPVRYEHLEWAVMDAEMGIRQEV